MTQAYPLQWPAGQPRTPASQRTRNWQFRTTQDIAQRKVLHEVKLLGGKNTVISTNIPTRRDGLPYANANQTKIEDRGIAVYFDLDGQSMCFACDKWDNFPDNMTSIAKTIEALRGIERWGSGHMMKQAFSGFAALPAPMKWWDILEVRQDASADVIQANYRRMARDHHPDNGGSQAKMAELNNARDEALRGRS